MHLATALDPHAHTCNCLVCFLTLLFMALKRLDKHIESPPLGKKATATSEKEMLKCKLRIVYPQLSTV